MLDLGRTGGSWNQTMRACVLWLCAVVAGAVFTPPPSPADAQVPSDTVTVVGKRPSKPCAENDTGCILAIAKEVWTRYPEQTERFCNNSIIRKQAEQQLIENIMGGGDNPLQQVSANNTTLGIPPALKKVCDYKPETPAGFDRSVSTWAPWVSVPSSADLAAAYPKAGRALPDGGDAKLNCSVTPKGKLEKCTVSQESPDHKGFGDAAMRLRGKFLADMNPAAPRGAPDSWIDISIHFPNPSTPAAAAAPLTHPDWIVLPDADRTARLYPAAARQAGVRTGVGRVDCQVGDNGALGACSLVGEEPPGLGFGDAALAAAPAMHANLWSRNGQRTPGAHIIVPLRFNADEGQKSGS